MVDDCVELWCGCIDGLSGLEEMFLSYVWQEIIKVGR